MAPSLKDKRVLIVGAAGGIGAATAEAFASAGASVLAAGRPGPKLEALGTRIAAEPVALDILDNPAIEAFFDKASPFDHVVITAAATKGGTVGALSLEDAKASMESAVLGRLSHPRGPPGSRIAVRSRSSRAFSRTGQARVRCCRARLMRPWKPSGAAWR